MGACIVNPERKIVGIGYNGMPNGCSDDELPWTRAATDRLETKYPYGKLVGTLFLLLSHLNERQISLTVVMYQRSCHKYNTHVLWWVLSFLLIQAIFKLFLAIHWYYDHPNCHPNQVVGAGHVIFA